MDVEVESGGLTTKFSMRVHIGHISPALAENIGDLEQRLARFAPLDAPLKLQRKPFGEWYYAFADMELTPHAYTELRRALNGVTFRQSKLEISEAKPKYQFAVPTPELPIRKTQEQLKRAFSARAHLNGRMREVERSEKDQREASFRVWIRDRLRRPKLRKARLWGVEKKPVERLVRLFEDGRWRDSEGKIVEVLAKDEHDRTSQLLETFSETGYLSDSDFEEFQRVRRDLEEVSSDSDLEIVPKNADTSNHKIAYSESGSDSDYDDVPVSEHPNTLSTDTATTSQGQTETLRSVLSVDQPFTLFGAPETSREAVQEPELVVEAVAEDEKPLGLFFAHAESPFLRSQTQSARLVGEFDPAAWDSQFWEHRGEWNRAMRRRRREAIKKQRKQQRR